MKSVAIAAFLAVGVLSGCVGSNPPTENDVATLLQKNMTMVFGMSGWQIDEMAVTNLKCNNNNNVYACSFDVSGKKSRRHAWIAGPKQEQFEYKNETGRFSKSGDVWTPVR